MLRGFDTDLSHSEIPYFNLPTNCNKESSDCLHGIFNSENLNLSFRKLDSYYTQKLTVDELDERHFINSDRLQTPLKLSPFVR